MGYACSHIGSLYESQFYDSLSTKKFQQAGIYFQKAGNTRSYACALRDLARQYVYSDSLDLAFKIIRKADSIASTLHDNEVYSSILNAYGNLYLLTDDFSQAEKYILQSLKLSKDTLPDYITLCDLYLTIKNIDRAKATLKKVSEQDWNKAIVEKIFLCYQIAKQEHNTDAALMHLETLMHIKDSIMIEKNTEQTAKLEKRYTTIKLKSENADLKIQKQQFLIFSIVLAMLILCISFFYYIQRRKSKEKIIRQTIKINQLNHLIHNLSDDINQKKALLEESKKKNIQQAEQLQIEISLLTKKCMKLERDALTSSNIYGKLQQLIKLKAPNNGKPLLTDNLRKQIVNEINAIYPNLKSYILERCPNISDSEWEYCCFCLLGFDGKESATLLNINPSSIHTKNNRLRNKLNITLPPQMSLCEYIIRQLH